MQFEMKHLNRLRKRMKKTGTAGSFARLLFSFSLAVCFAGLFPSPVQADVVPIDLVLGGTGATPWVISDIQPGSSGTKTVELRNDGNKDGFVTIWISDIASSEGINPESETGDTGEPGELIDYLLLDIVDDSLVAYMDLPATLDDFPHSYRSANSIEVIPIKSGETVTIQWTWELPATIGNDVQGDTASFTINYLLRECRITDVSAVTTGAGSFISEVIAESDTGKGRISINKDVVGQTSEGQPLSEIWLIEVDKEPPAELEDETIFSLWELGPGGATFNQPIDLTLEAPPGAHGGDVAIARWDEGAGRWVKLGGSIVDAVNNTVSAQISHFSRYAVAGTVTPPPAPPASGAEPPAGDDYSSPRTPTEPSIPPATEPRTVFLNVDMLGQERTVEIGADGTLSDPLTLSDAKGDFTIELKSGSRIITGESVPPQRLQLTVDEESIELPDKVVLLSPVYRLAGYLGDIEVSPVYFKPPATLTIKYDNADLPENILEPFIAYLTGDEGLIPIAAFTNSLFEPGRAIVEISQTALFVVAAELVPPPPPLPADFQISNLNINPQTIRPGEPVTISVSIDNKGESGGSYDLYLYIDGIVKMVKKVTLMPQSREEIIFEVSDLPAGTHHIRIGNLTGQFRITRVITLPIRQAVNWLSFDVGIGAAVLTSLVLLLLLRKRHTPQSE
jgi:hypothetical protein